MISENRSDLKSILEEPSCGKSWAVLWAKGSVGEQVNGFHETTLPHGYFLFLMLYEAVFHVRC